MRGNLGAVLTRRALLARLGLAAVAIPLLAACGTAATPSPSGASSEPLKVSKPELGATASATTATASASSATTTAKGEPKGKIVQAETVTLSPVWLDPQEYQPQITPYGWGYLLHDALVKHMPGKPFAPSLAESYEIAQDYKSATFKLRQGIKFHDGSPITPEDVKFTFEKYRGANASVLHDKTQSVDVVDDRTIRFTFKEPFLDFLLLYGSPASGSGWVVPRAYYEKVGPNGYKQKPIGAGPYKLVRQQAGTEQEYEAFTDYWRKVPAIKTWIKKGVPEGATRMAMIQTGEADVTIVQGQMIDVVKKSPNLRLHPTRSGSVWLECVPDRPDSPLKDMRVRQAISLAIDRKAINDAELGGLSPIEGNWIPEEYQGALARPVPPYDLAKAKQLMAEAGVPNGFEVGTITPLPPYTTWAERIASQLVAIGIRTKVNTVERGAFYDGLAPGPNRLKGFVIQFSAALGDAASRIRESATCRGMFSGLCVEEVDAKMKRYDSSTDLQERKRILDEVQAYLLDNYLLIPLPRNVLPWVAGPRIANDLSEIIGAVPQYSLVAPYEDARLKES